jgi:hypothetical protein
MDIQKGRGDEEYDIGILVEEGRIGIQRSLDYCREMSFVSKDKSEKEWKICMEMWHRMDETMLKNRFPMFSPPK